MSRYIHKYKMKNGNTAVRLMKKNGRKVEGVEHIGVAHDEEELKIFLILAQEKLNDTRQGELKLFEEERRELSIKQVRTYSKYLFDVISGVYDKLKFDEVSDEVFREITIARIIEPSSKLDNRNIDKQLKKAQEQKESNAKIKKAKFLKIIKSKKEIDYEAVTAARQMAGIKGYATNLTCDELTIIDAYHNLFQVEKSFRMTKSDLQARPIFHKTRDSIEAHLTICFAALAISRYIQDKTKLSIKKFVQRLKELKTGIVQIGNKQYTAEPVVDSDTEKIVKLL